MKEVSIYLDDIVTFKVKDETLMFFDEKTSKFNGNKINCKFYQIIPLFYEFCIQNPNVEPLYNFERVEVEVVLSIHGGNFLSQKNHSLNISKKGDKETIKCTFNELVRVFGEYYDEDYCALYNPFLYNEIKLYINK